VINTAASDIDLSHAQLSASVSDLSLTLDAGSLADVMILGADDVAGMEFLDALTVIEADEVTYNLHIMLRFELEQEMIAGRISVADLPAAWNDRMESWLGIRPENDTDGVLQDIHWSLGAIGYFPTYALGNLMSVQLFNAAERDIPALNEQIATGQFAPLLGWLRSNVHQYGRRRSANELLEKATGSTLNAAPWLDYIRQKFGALYGF